MQSEKQPKSSRAKKKIAEMMPVKKWLSLPETCCYMDMSAGHFEKLAMEKGLTLSMLNKKKYYKVAELDALIEDNILIRNKNL